MRSHVADSVLGARRMLIGSARIYAAIGTASPIARTVRIRAAFNACALSHRIALQSGRTATCSVMIMRIAFSGQGTRIVQGARIMAFAVEALFVVGAFFVGGAADAMATDERVAREARPT